MAVLVPLKRKYRPYDGDYFAKKCGVNGDHQGNKRRKKNGPKTYDKSKHVLVLQRNGKLRNRKLGDGR